MIQGGIEATCRADDLRLPGVNHALQQFTHVLVGEAGDAGQAAGVHGRGALLQQRVVSAAQVHLAILEEGHGVRVGAQPVEGEDALLIGGELEAEDGGLLAEGVFGGDQEALALFVLGVGNDTEAAAHGPQQLERAGFGSGSGRVWSDGVDKQDGAAGALGELGQGGKRLAQVAGAAGVQGVEDDAGGVGAGDRFFQEVQVLDQGEGTLFDGDGGAVDLCDGGEQEDAGGVASGGQETGFDGVAAMVLTRDEDNCTLGAGGATGQGMAAGDAGGDVQGEQGGAAAGFAFEQGEGTQGEVVLPEPGDGALDDGGEDEARGRGVDFGSGLGPGVRIDGAVVFVDAGEGDAARARAGVLLVQFFGGQFEVFRTQSAHVFLSLEFAFLTHGFTKVFQIFVHLFERVSCSGHGGFLSVRGGEGNEVRSCFGD